MLVDLGRNDIGKISRAWKRKSRKISDCGTLFLCHASGLHSNRNHQKGQRCHRRSGCHLTCRNPFRGTEIPCLPDHSGTGTKQDEAFTAVQSDMWISQEIWMCALQSVWYIRKKMKSVSGREPESWQTAYRKKNLKSARIRQERW